MKVAGKGISKFLSLLFNPITLVIVGVFVVFIIAGGVAWTQGLLSPASTQSIPQSPQGIVGDELVNCQYSTGTVQNDSAITIGVASNNRDVYVTIDNSSYFAGDGALDDATGDRLNISVICERKSNTGEDSSVKVIAGSENFLSDINVASANEYNLISIASGNIKSQYFNDYVRNTYVNDGATATTTSRKEAEIVEFTESQKTREISIIFDLDSTAVQQLGEGSQYTKELNVYQEVNGVRTPLYNLYVSKVA